MVDPAHVADTLSKTELVRQLKQIKKAAPEMEQRLAKDQVKRKTTNDAEKTCEADKSDLLMISEEAREKTKQKMPKKKKEEDKDDSGQSETSEDGHLDIEA